MIQSRPSALQMRENNGPQSPLPIKGSLTRRPLPQKNLNQQNSPKLSPIPNSLENNANKKNNTRTSSLGILQVENVSPQTRKKNLKLPTLDNGQPQAKLSQSVYSTQSPSIFSRKSLNQQILGKQEQKKSTSLENRNIQQKSGRTLQNFRISKNPQNAKSMKINTEIDSQVIQEEEKNEEIENESLYKINKGQDSDQGLGVVSQKLAERNIQQIMGLQIENAILSYKYNQKELQEQKKDNQNEEQRKDNQKEEQRKDVVRLYLMLRHGNWREKIKSALKGKVITEIYITFVDIDVEIDDGILFNCQVKTLRILELDFSENKYFNDQSLLFISTLKLKQLEKIKVNVSGTQCSKVGANFLIFDLNYIPEVEVIYAESYRQQVIKYQKEKSFIEVDFSVQASINKSEITALQDCITKSNQQHLSISLLNIHILTNDILKQLGSNLKGISILRISFQDCLLPQSSLHSFIQGLMNSRTKQVLENNFMSHASINNETLEGLWIDWRGNIEEINISLIKQLNGFPNLKWFGFKIDEGFIPYQNQQRNRMSASRRGLHERASASMAPLFRQENKFISEIKQRNYYENTIVHSQSNLIFSKNEQKTDGLSWQMRAVSLSQKLKEKMEAFEIWSNDHQCLVNLKDQQLHIDVSGCDVSGLSSVDIEKTIVCGGDEIRQLNLNLKKNWQMTSTHIYKLINKINSISKLEKLNLDLTSVFLYESEIVILSLCLLQKEGLQLEMIHDFQDQKLFELSKEDNSLSIRFLGAFWKSHLSSLKQMNIFSSALENIYLRPTLRSLSIEFSFNIQFENVWIARLFTSLSQFPVLCSLSLDLSFCNLNSSHVLNMSESIQFLSNSLTSFQALLLGNPTLIQQQECLETVAYRISKFTNLTNFRLATDSIEVSLQDNNAPIEEENLNIISRQSIFTVISHNLSTKTKFSQKATNTNLSQQLKSPRKRGKTFCTTVVSKPITENQRNNNQQIQDPRELEDEEEEKNDQENNQENEPIQQQQQQPQRPQQKATFNLDIPIFQQFTKQQIRACQTAYLAAITKRVENNTFLSEIYLPNESEGELQPGEETLKIICAAYKPRIISSSTTYWKILRLQEIDNENINQKINQIQLGLQYFNDEKFSKTIIEPKESLLSQIYMNLSLKKLTGCSFYKYFSPVMMFSTPQIFSDLYL